MRDEIEAIIRAVEAGFITDDEAKTLAKKRLGIE